MIATQRLQPFVAAERLKRAYRSYITTSFPLRRPELRDRFDRLIDEERLLWQDAFVSLERSPKRGRTFAELEQRGAIGPELTREVAFGFERLHDHQSRAAERLSSRLGPRSTLVATGTGSGKTEAFLVPILDHCLREPGPGVKAILLYPMNALANDQLKRLRRLLAGTELVTFARYTGDTPYDEERAAGDGQPTRPAESPPAERFYRRDILRDPPNLLLTNYTMLELLLTRKQEREGLLRGAPLRYLVIDEVHTFQGLRGTEVACLVRRLKEHVGLERGRLTCVGTSATLQRGGDPAELVKFATDLFGEPFEPDSVVVEEAPPLPETGEVPPPAGPISDELLTADVTEPANLRALAEALLGRDLMDVGDRELPARVHELTRAHPLFVELERFLATPKPVADLASHLRGLPGRAGLDDATLRREATAALLVGASALAPRPDGEEAEPRFRPKVHLLMRSLSPLARCLDPGCGELLTDGRQDCGAEAHPDHRRALPLGVCRTCGQDYWMGAAPRGAIDRKLRRRAQAERLAGATLQPAGDDSGETVYLMPRQAETLAPADEDDDAVEEVDPEAEDEDGEPVPSNEGGVAVVEMLICSGCRTLRRRETERCPGQGCDGKAASLTVNAFVGGSKCPLCLSTGKGRRPEIITPLRSGASSSVSVLTTELFDQLSEDERRTLIFADSRQDTAHQAGFLRERHQVFVRRQLISQSLAEQDGPIALPELAQHVYQHAVARFGEAEALNLLIPNDRHNFEERGFYRPDALPTRADVDRARRRLNWHCHLELTALAQQRNALEREGLIGVSYSRLEELAERVLPDVARFGITSPARLSELVRAILDVVRSNKAVDCPPFRDYLDYRSPAVSGGEANPSRYLRIPTVFGTASSRHRYYWVLAWHNERGRRTGVDDVVARLYPSLQAELRHDLIDLIVERLRDADFLHLRRVGTERKYGRQQTEGLQLAADRIEVRTVAGAFRCRRCQRARAWSLTGEEGQQVCTTYECGGEPEAYVPDPEESYYVALYRRRQPKTLHAAEHSGQLSGEQRQLIERQFNEQAINVLVCTPTLELGVDLPDLVSLLMRNVPPTPANYAQRAGRAGRERRVALVVCHAGQGPHDSYFFSDPTQMIAGEIRSPVLLLDNEEIVRRHVRSLVLERLDTEVPSHWQEIADTDEGSYRSDLPERFQAELADPAKRAAISVAVRRAFADAELDWLDGAFVERELDDFPGEVERALRTWCEEYADLAEEHGRIRTGGGSTRARRRASSPSSPSAWRPCARTASTTPSRSWPAVACCRATASRVRWSRWWMSDSARSPSAPPSGSPSTHRATGSMWRGRS